jgi:hypothetical protein
MHQEYMDRGETFYTGRAESVSFSAGNERVKFMWQLNSDPRITQCVFYWDTNEGRDSSVVLTNRTESGPMDLETILDVREGIYSFTLITKDSEGHKSLATERTVQIYGPTYISRLANRNIVSTTFNDGKLTITWASTESELIQYTTVNYTDYTDPSNPVRRSIQVENSDITKDIEGVVRAGDVFSVSTSYLPNGGLDVMSALPIEYTIR